MKNFLIFALLSSLFLASCGRKGPIYLPDEAKNDTKIQDESE
jgi:predicted small lipoprotein YifL